MKSSVPGIIRRGRVPMGGVEYGGIIVDMDDYAGIWRVQTLQIVEAFEVYKF